jgi:hypothetical protein
MLMAIHFPDEFVIAHGIEVEIRHEAEIFCGGSFVVGVVASPIDVRTGDQSGSEQRKAVRQDLFGGGKHTFFKERATQRRRTPARVWQNRRHIGRNATEARLNRE